MILRLSAVVAALLLVAACTDSSSTTTSTVAATGATDTMGATTAPPTETTAPPETTPASTLPPGTEELPQEIREELAELIEVTQEIRQLEFLEQPNIVVVSQSELAERVREQLEEDLEDLPADEALYRLLGLIDDDLDLATLYTDLYSEQVAGYYDGEVRELVVPRAEGGFTPLQKATLVHELTHALTDQHYEFHPRYTDLLDNDRYDEAAALQALIEGDAVLTELLYLRTLSPEEQSDFFTESLGADREVFDSAPKFIRDALIFPYDHGFLFVERLYRTGQFEAIADAYRTPPVSTEQIIRPEDYPADAPIPVEVEEIVLDGFELEYRSTWGELGFTLMLDQVLGESVAATAASGWGGDSYQLLYDGSDVVLVLHYRGDSVGDAEVLAAALRDYVAEAMDVGDGFELDGGTAYSGSRHAWVYQDAADVIFVATSRQDVFEEAVSAALPVPATTTTG